ncbi:MAG TPA: hypothetical protein VJ973_00875, partial [Christiangramia sp.]|nr:hypothetical protein [Christiangramia sp.]
NTAKLVQEIAAASKEQATGSDQVNNAMQQLNELTQQNAASSEEMATGAEELSSQSEQLKDSIQFFNIGNGKSIASFQKYQNPQANKIGSNGNGSNNSVPKTSDVSEKDEFCLEL